MDTNSETSTVESEKESTMTAETSATDVPRPRKRLSNSNKLRRTTRDISHASTDLSADDAETNDLEGGGSSSSGDASTNGGPSMDDATRMRNADGSANTEAPPSEENGASLSDGTSSDNASTVHAGEQATWSSSFTSFFGQLTTNIVIPVATNFVAPMATRTLTLLKETLSYIPQYDGEIDSDSDLDIWLDSGDWSDFEEAVEEVQPKDRLHSICHELMCTEEQYVKRLGILKMVKERTAKVLKPDIAKQMFQDIEVIHEFHSENLLPSLKERLQHWEKHRRVGDIMKKMSPFLKLYTEYVKNFERSSQLVDSYEEKSNSFAKLLKEVQENPEYGRLRVQAHMLEPVQRVPRYRLLLADYLKRLPNDSPDKEDVEKALEHVGDAANHYQNMMARDSRIGKLVQLQSQLEGSVNIISSSRDFLKEAKLKTLSVKSGKAVDRTMFLFNDLLLISSEVSLPVPGLPSRYRVRHSFDLQHSKLADASNLELPHTFYIKSTDKVVEICCSSEDEKSQWVDELRRLMGEQTKEKLLRTGSRVVVRDGQRVGLSLGERAPVLKHLTEASQCMICGEKFGAIRRKHHCRACGILVCSNCSAHKATLDYDKSKPLRVCDECFVSLQGQEGNGGSPPPTPKTKTQGQCLEKDCLQLSSDDGKAWQKRWFAIHDSFIIYSFKAPQDINPMTSYALKGHTYELDTCPQKGPCIKLQGEGKTYYLYSEEGTTINRWYKALEFVAGYNKMHMGQSMSEDRPTPDRCSQDSESTEIDD